MATLRNKRRLAAGAKGNQEGSPRNSHSGNSAASRINEEYISEVSDKVEDRVSNKLSQEFTRTKSPVLGTLFKHDKFLRNLQVWLQSGTVPVTFRDMNVENQQPTEDGSQKDPHSKVSASIYRSPQPMHSGSEETSYRFGATTFIPSIQLLAFWQFSQIMNFVNLLKSVQILEKQTTSFSVISKNVETEEK